MNDVVCRSCGTRGLEGILSLGEQPLANALRPFAVADAHEPRYPLDVAFCPACCLVQLIVSIPPDTLFTQYPYFSSYSDTVVDNARAIARRMTRQLQLGRSDLAMEIASNDGYLLRYYREQGIPVLGIDPAANVAAVAELHGVATRCEFFGEELAEELRAIGQRASVLHANNVLAHVPDVGGVLRGVSRVLRDDGYFVIETPYVRDLVDHVEFDTIYHEHLFYYSATSLSRLLRTNGLELVDVERIAIHGGSLRAFVQLRGVRYPRPGVGGLLAEERAVGIDRLDYYRDFATKVDGVLAELRGLLSDLRARGHRVAGYGAAAKSTVLLNALGVDADTIEFVADRNPHKHEHFVPGTHIPIVPAERLLAELPDYTLLFTWNHAAEVLAQQAEYRARGGRFVVPIPHPHTV